jgi:hypothetical protein
VRHDTHPVGADLDPSNHSATLHPRSAFLSRNLELSQVQVLLIGQALSLIYIPCRRPQDERRRLGPQ